MFIVLRVFSGDFVSVLMYRRTIRFMWNRAELKQNGKAAFTRNYLHCVITSMVYAAAIGSQGIVRKNYSKDDFNFHGGIEGMQASVDAFMNQIGLSWAVLLPIFFAIIGGTIIFCVIWKIFLTNPLIVGCSYFYSRNAYEPMKISAIFYPFKDGRYGRVILGMVCRNLVIFLWSLLLIIPGIVKSYEYRMVPFLLADEPDMDREDVFQLSRDMMQGNKWDAFVFDMSFFGWFFLSVISGGLFGIFYAFPYYHASCAELYHELKRNV